MRTKKTNQPGDIPMNILIGFLEGDLIEGEALELNGPHSQATTLTTDHKLNRQRQ